MNDIRYLTDSYAPKIKRINELNAPLNFVFITDQHHLLNRWALAQGGITDPKKSESAVDAIESIRYVLERCPGIGLVISGGDIGNDYNRTPDGFRASLHEVMDALYSLPVPVHCIVGNHDDGLGNAIDHGDDTVPFCILPDEMHALCMKNNPTPENYYYIDTEGYRLVFLNSCDKPYERDENGQYPYGWRLEISDKQAKWFEREALNTDLPVILFSHAPIHNAGIYGTEGADPMNLRDYIKPFDDTLNAPRIYYDMHKSKNVVAAIHGHVHFDNLLYDDDIVTVTTLCSMMQVWAPISPNRVPGTPSETAFDVFSIKDGILYITRFGAGEDRVAQLIKLKGLQG